MILAAVLGTSRYPKWKFRELLKENNCFSCSSSSCFPISRATSSENMRLCSHFRASCWELQDQQKSAHWCSWLLDFSMSMSFGVNSPEACNTLKKSNYLNKDSNQRTFSKNQIILNPWGVQILQPWMFESSCRSVRDGAAGQLVTLRRTLTSRNNLWLHTGWSGLSIGYWL